MAEIQNRLRKLKVGDKAPDFTLETHNEGELNLSWYQGRMNVVLAFYPGDFTPNCSNQIPLYNDYIEKFNDFDCQVFAISVDSIACHTAWAKSLGGLKFPLMSDYFPHGEVALKYGILNERGYAERTVFLIDKNGVIQFIEELDYNLLPDNEKLYNELANLKS